MSTANKTRTFLATIALIAIGILVIVLISTAAGAAEAHRPAPDRRPCVSKREFNSVNTALSRKDVEKQWEVTNAGERFYLVGMGNIYVYERCDGPANYPYGYSWYGVKYEWVKGEQVILYVIWNYDPGLGS